MSSQVRLIGTLLAQVEELKAENCALKQVADDELVDTLIFDIDDCLYPLSCGFSEHRNGKVVEDFIVEKLGFATRAEAKACRDKYFEKYHSTLKSLTVADEEGALPKHFNQPDLGAWWSANCQFAKFLTPQPTFIAALKSCPLKKVAFTNAPREYAKKALETLELIDIFDHIFAVEDVMPACKPQAAAFEKVLTAVGSIATRSVMFEDSVKNIRGAKKLGLRTVLIRESTYEAQCQSSTQTDAMSNAFKPEDECFVDAKLEDISDMKRDLPFLWNGRFPRRTGADLSLASQ